MGSKSSSSSSSQNNSRTVDQSIVDSSNGDGSRTNTSIAGDVSGSVTINTSDFGAIKAAENISEKAFGFASDAGSQAGDLARAALQTTKETASESVQKFAALAEDVKTDGAAQTKKLIAITLISLTLIGAIAAAVIAISKGKKS